MPQMMPINWLLSILFFIFLFIIFNIMNYFIFNNNNNLYKKNYFKSKNSPLWKW
uniref:ATP synthase F0 subunit 8 n=1 Tax=Parantica melaneus TaxID=1288029 RepID=UPI002008EDFE|nr:ATP synthase F0 subunit 8 [Parantica melaneus]UPA56402.1 ATP synthase F0 subunit 8 [Parantica melaneus]